MAQFTVHPHPQPAAPEVRDAILATPGFGEHFSDHMVLADWDELQGWHDLRIVATGPLAMHPSAAVLHYGQEIFEGMKAYRHDDGSVWLFRPDRNAARFASSATRLDMPVLPPETFLDSVLELVDLDRAWVPGNAGEQNLYLRPFMIASEPLIGVRAAKRYTYCVLATPAGAYYSSPMSLWITPTYSRAAVGGTGAAKCGGNYAASLAAADEAHAQGCGQVLWLDGAEHRWLEECGTMNIVLVTADGELLTPDLARGTILDGVTRDSLLRLAPEHGLRAVERPIDVDELLTRVRDGSVTEVFACGTAAVVTPITGFKAPGTDHVVVADGQVGTTTAALRQHLLDIQYGRAADEHGWMRRVG